MKKYLLIALSMVLVAALSVAGTLAYLQFQTPTDVNVMTLGNVKIEQHEYERVQNADGSYQMVTSPKYGEGFKLKEFSQNKPLYPATGSIKGWGDSVYFDQLGAGASGGMAVFDGLNNVQDKFVLVENTGKTAAYVRTIIAIEVGSVTDDVIGISLGDFWKWTNHGYAEIDGNNYEIHEGVYTGSDTRHIDGILPAGEYTYNSLGQIYLSNTVTNEVCENLDGNKNGTFDVLVVSQAVQAAGFDDAATALDASFGKITTTTHPWVKTVNTNAGNDTAFEDAVKDENSDLIIIGLTDDVTYDVAAWANDAMGGAATKNIIINGNGHTITFNQTNTDWNNIVTNGAKLIINNAKITNAGNNDGPWNRHDLNFACDVEFNNVVSDKAFAFKANATLNNVTINDANTSDTYAIWIQPKGQTVTLNNVTIDMLACTDGRGIKIDNQYIGSDAKKVTLNVSNTTFKTEEKSAILVNSPAGADVTISNIDISGVAADSVNAVWVDDASSAYADLVVVTGASKIIEP